MTFLHSLPTKKRSTSPLLTIVPEFYCQQKQENVINTELQSIASLLRKELIDQKSQIHTDTTCGIILVETAYGKKGYMRSFSPRLGQESFACGWLPTWDTTYGPGMDEDNLLTSIAKTKSQLIDISNTTKCKEYKKYLQDLQKEKNDFRIAQRNDRIERRKGRRTYQEKKESFVSRQRTQSVSYRLLSRQNEFQIYMAQMEKEKTHWNKLIQNIDELRSQYKMYSERLRAQVQTLDYFNFIHSTYDMSQLLKLADSFHINPMCPSFILRIVSILQGYSPLGITTFSLANPEQKTTKRAKEIISFKAFTKCANKEVRKEFIKIRENYRHTTLDIVYEDPWILLVNKPSGIPSVPGRSLSRQKSILNLVMNAFTDITGPGIVHRLDMGTSGLIVIARDPESHRHLSKQFQQRKVKKRYTAILLGEVRRSNGIIKLPLKKEKDGQPLQVVDAINGKESCTFFEVIRVEKGYTHVSFLPQTGRMHQLRVHASHPQGLHAPILGDALYGVKTTKTRLHLHACELSFMHPYNPTTVQFESKAPF